MSPTPQICDVPDCQLPRWVAGAFCAEHLIEAISTIVPEAERTAFWSSIDSMLGNLSYHAREMTRLLYGFGDGYTYTYDEIARIFQISVEEVQQIERDSLHRLAEPALSDALSTLCKQFFVPQSTTPIDSTAPSIFLQSLVVPSGKTSDGELISAVTVPWFMIAKMIERDPEVIYHLPHRKWEELLAGWYTAAGYDEVVLTPRSGDRGRDVIAVRHGLCSVRIVDQVKAYKPGHLVTADEVRSVLGVVHIDSFSKGYVTTTSDFAPHLLKDPKLAENVPFRVELINGKRLVERLTTVANREASV